MNTFARIKGTGSYLPPKVLTNTELEVFLNTSDEWITTRTGIKSRHIAQNISTVDMAVIASNNALEDANITAKDLDLIILATTTPDKIFPASATILQERIGASCPAFDIQAVCAGYIFALVTAESYIKNGYNNILVVGSEVMSKILNWQDRNTAVLFGDGAGATIVSRDTTTGIIYSKLCSDGKYLSSLQTSNTAINQEGFITMNGGEVFKIAVKNLTQLAEDTLTECGLTSEDIDYLVPHQANIRIIESIAQRINLPIDKVIITLETHGNTSAASIPLALDVAIKDGRIQKGHKLMFEGIGGGFSWGSILLEL